LRELEEEKRKKYLGEMGAKDPERGLGGLVRENWESSMVGEESVGGHGRESANPEALGRGLASDLKEMKRRYKRGRERLAKRRRT